MGKKHKGGQTLAASAALLLLVIAGAWGLKAGSQAQQAAEAAAQAEQEAQQAAEEAAAAQAEQEAQQAAEAAAAQAEQQARQAAEAAAAAQAGQAVSAEQEIASFTTDYDSMPLLNTTPIRDLSLEVGATEDEIRLNWLSPDRNPGQVSWYTIQNGDFQLVDAECTASAAVPGYYVNKAAVTGLEPGMAYAYKVGNDTGGWSPEYRYAVPDADTGGGFTFLVTSDAEIGQDQYNEMQTTIDDWDRTVTRLTNYVPEAQFLIHAGDQVSQFGNEEQYAGFLNHLALYKIPLVPVVGNHDVANEDTVEQLGYPAGPYFYEHFNVPNRSDEYGYSEADKTGDYYFTRGDALFIVLNSCTSQATDIHEQYVPQVIAEHPDLKWRIIIQHYPAYSSVERYQQEMDPWIRNSLAYICEDNDIDLVISGHDAVYSRSAFTNRQHEIYEGCDYSSGAAAANPEGTMHVTCSTATGSIYQAAAPNDKLAFQGQPGKPMALRIDVTDTELHLRAYVMDSWTVYDEYTIQKT